MDAGKQCTRCGEIKPLDDFHRNHRMRDGHINQCKSCLREDPRRNELQRLRRARNPQATRADRKKSAREQRRRHPEKMKARKAVTNALQAGRLEKPATCEDCRGDFPPTGLDGHHDDYGKPLEIRWLCRTCHNALHKAEREDS